jgi:hypothetical protein
MMPLAVVVVWSVAPPAVLPSRLTTSPATGLAGATVLPAELEADWTFLPSVAPPDGAGWLDGLDAAAGARPTTPVAATDEERLALCPLTARPWCDRPVGENPRLRAAPGAAARLAARGAPPRFTRTVGTAPALASVEPPGPAAAVPATTCEELSGLATPGHPRCATIALTISSATAAAATSDPPAPSALRKPFVALIGTCIGTCWT